jgi:sec-independent protein translocase protein TatC
MNSKATESKLTLLDHLTELRSCLIRSLLALAAGMLLCLYFSKEIFRFLQQPLLDVMPTGSGFIATSPLEAFLTYLKVALLSGVFLSSPFILYQVWRFVAPGLYLKEKRVAATFVTFSSLFFVGGALFGYYVIFPVGFRFFVSALAGTEIQFLPQMKDYLGFISKMLLTFGFVFEMPLILILLAKIGLVHREMLTRARRYVLVLMFLIAGMLTPGPDVLSQFLLAVPLLVLYELSVLGVWVMERKSSKVVNSK